MNLFGTRKVTDAEARAELAELRAELQRQASIVRQIESEQALMHDQVRKWMRRAVAAERRTAPNQELELQPAEATPAPSPRTWGARARIMARRGKRASLNGGEE